LVRSSLFWHTHLVAGIPEGLLDEGYYPTLTAGVTRPARGPGVVCAFTTEITKLPSKPNPEPFPLVHMTLRMYGYESGSVSDQPEVWAESVKYWSSRCLVDPGLAKPDAKGSV
jgi:hypothetical protein